jgi:hypothetical protein
MNDITRERYLYLKHEIEQSSQPEEVIQRIQGIAPVLTLGEESSWAYDLLVDAFQALRNLTQDDATEAKQMIVGLLLPYLDSDAYVHVSIVSAMSRLRDCLVEWIDQYPESERHTLQAYILDQLHLKLQRQPSSSTCWIISDIGFRQENIVNKLWEIAEQNDTDLGDTALVTLTALGVPVSEKERLLSALHKRVLQRIAVPLITALRRLADPSSFLPVLHSWLQDDAKQINIGYLSLALRILVDIADHSNSEEIQDQIWHAIVELFQKRPERFAFDIYLGGDIASQCDSIHVVPILVQWIEQERENTEVATDHRRLLSLRLEDCVRPRQLQGWKATLSIPSAIDVLRRDACLDTHYEGRATTHEMLIKEAAWQTLLCIGDGQILQWFKEAVSNETNRYIRREMCDLFACLRLDPLPSDIIQWITEPFDAKLPDDSPEFVARLGAIRVARSSASRASFEALLACGLSVNGENLREVVDALDEVALALARSGDISVVNQLVDTVVEHPESRYRMAAGSALESLTAEGFLSKQDIVRLTATLLKQHDRDPFERSMIVAALGHLSMEDFPNELLLPFRQWAIERNDWIGIQSLFALARRDDFLTYQDLVARAGLQRDGEKYLAIPKMKYTVQGTQLIGLLYTLHPEALRPAVASLIEELDWSSVVPLIWGMYVILKKDSQSPLPPEITEAFVRRIRQRQTRTSAELGIFQVMAELMPESFAQERWDALWGNWLPDARTTLAETLGAAVYSTGESQAKAIALLCILLGDGQYAVRRASYRSLAAQSPRTLQTFCTEWAKNPSRELRQRAAEAWAWLPRDSEESIEIYQKLTADVERSVRDVIHRSRHEQRKREWGREYLARIRQVSGDANDEVLDAWRYGQALTHVGDDATLQVLRTDLRTRSLPPHLRHWIRRIIKDMDENWQKAVRKWPQPWRSWKGSIEEGNGWILLPNEQRLPVQYALWLEQAATFSESSSWGGTIQVQGVSGFEKVEIITLYLSDARQGRAWITHHRNDMITIIGQGTYPV